MEYGFSILMFCFAGALLLYAGLLVAEKKRPDLLIPRRFAVSMKKTDWIKHARRLAKIVALCALAPFLSGVAGLFGQPLLAGIVFVAALIAAIWLGVRITRDAAED